MKHSRTTTLASSAAVLPWDRCLRVLPSHEPVCRWGGKATAKERCNQRLVHLCLYVACTQLDYVWGLLFCRAFRFIYALNCGFCGGSICITCDTWCQWLLLEFDRGVVAFPTRLRRGFIGLASFHFGILFMLWMFLCPSLTCWNHVLLKFMGYREICASNVQNHLVSGSFSKSCLLICVAGTSSSVSLETHRLETERASHLHVSSYRLSPFWVTLLRHPGDQCLVVYQ